MLTRSRYRREVRPAAMAAGWEGPLVPPSGAAAWPRFSVWITRCAATERNRMLDELPPQYPKRGYMVDVEASPTWGYHRERWYSSRREAFKAMRLLLAACDALTDNEWRYLIDTGAGRFQ